MSDDIKIIPLGGCGEIGMNMTLFCFMGRYYFVDGGALFPDASQIGIDLILPDTRFIDENQIRPEAWLITHGHEDHIGALPHLYKKYPAPIYGTPFTIELIRAKFEDVGIRNVTYHVWKYFNVIFFKNVKVTPFPVNHSIADASGLFFETTAGNILHMGDFRIDYKPPEHTMTHENITRVLKGKPVSLMMSDSTNVFNLGTDGSETDVLGSLEKYFLEKTGALIVSTFASNIWRLKSVFEAAKRARRKVALFGRTMHRNIEIARKLNLIQFNDNVLVPIEDLKSLPRTEVCILCTGSQGEIFSGLHRLAWNSSPDFKLAVDDTILFSSRVIPGNEKTIDDLVVQLERQGCRVITSKEDRSIHVSGHAYLADLKTCINTVNPAAFMPVHGTYRHLKRHREVAIECGISPERSFLVENGDVVVVAPEPVGVVDNVKHGRDYVCPGGIFSEISQHYKDRMNLVRTGVLVASFVLKNKGEDLACDPVIVLKGVPLRNGEMVKKSIQIFDQIKKTRPKRRRPGEDSLYEDLRIALRKHVEKVLKFKTTVVVVLNRVS